MECILISGLEIFGHHGVSPEEREHGQNFWVDVKLELKRPSAEDDLAQTVDYTAVIEVIRELNAVRRFQLIESFAQALADEILERFPYARGAHVRVRKKLVDIDLDYVAAEVSRER
jgi:dihydroneopterin aldolase